MQLAMDRAIKREGIALDRASVRTTDSDGHMHVASSIISAAAVNEYLGGEIPDFEALGLDPQRRYKLYRDPAELEKGAPSLHGKPLLIIHRPQSADDHDREVVVGSVSNPVWDAPKLKGGLSIWDGEAIAGIESGEQRSLSAGYQYVPVMTPGTTPEGEAYDGVMTKISFNHVALVTEPRVIGAVVGDSAISNLKEFEMTKVLLTRMGSVARGALMIALKPKLAQDAKIDLSPLLVNLTHKNFKAKKPAIVAGIQKLTTGKLATDASIDDVIKLVDALEDNEVLEGADTDPDTGATIEPEETMDSEGGALMEFLKGKLGADDYAKACEMSKPGAADADEDDEETKKKKKEEEAKLLAGDVEAAVKEKTKDMVTKGAMDTAIAKAVTEATAKVTTNARETLEAREAVHPFVGKLPLALDSAVGVYQSALGVLGVEDADKINDLGALKAVLKAQTVPSAQTVKPRIAQDAATTKSLAERFPHAATIKVSA